MLAAAGLTLWRGTTRLFEELRFSVPAGTALLIEGPNGSGKTTLLRVIAGLTMPEAGRVTWEGGAVREQLQTGRLELAFAGHALALKTELTTRENLLFCARLAARNGGVDEVLAATGLSGCADLEVRLLSAGQKRRASLARVLLSGAQLWLLDEPHTNLDADGRQLLDKSLREHLVTGGTLVVATHQALELGPAAVSRLRLDDA